MDQLVSVLKKIFAYPKRILVTVFASILLLFLLFPFSDLSDYVSTMVSNSTNNSVYLQFEDLSLAVLPGPGLKFSDVIVESAMAPELQLTSLSVAPSITGIFSLMAGKPLFSADAEGLFKGDLSLSTSNSKTIKDDSGLHIYADYKNFDLKTLTRTLNEKNKLPFTCTGSGQIEADLDISTTMTIQPEGVFKASLQKPNIPSFTVNLGSFGSLPLPGLKLDAVTMNADLKGGRLTIKESQLGSNKNDLYGNVSGTVDMTFGKRFNIQRYGLYDLKIDLTVKNSMKSELGAMLAFISQYESKTLNGARYRFRIKGQVGATPKFSAL